MYTTVFNKDSMYFRKDEVRLNRTLLEQKQAYANDQLRARGHIFLNEVLDLLGLPRVRDGQFAGWVWSKFRFDSLVDFGIETITLDEAPLTFNCRENILDDVFGSIPT